MKISLGIFCTILLVAAYAFFFFQADIVKYLTQRSDIIKSTTNKIRYHLNRPLIGTPDLGRLKERLKHKKLTMGSPIFIRIFKKESQLELWIKSGPIFKLFATYPICTWSGFLGPKLKQGDYQAPEGFYTVNKRALNPNSRFHRSFNLGYPNKFDQAHKRTGDFLMVHGNCVSAGCYAMTDPVITELWSFVTAALNKGQKRFHVHAYPFRMTEMNLMLHRSNSWSPFWKDLKKGYDAFEKSKIPPTVTVCKKRYQISPSSNPKSHYSKIPVKCMRNT